jgi:hypothetical protein
MLINLIIGPGGFYGECPMTLVYDSIEVIRAQGKTKVKWTNDTRVLVCIVGALLFTLWAALQFRYY